MSPQQHDINANTSMSVTHTPPVGTVAMTPALTRRVATLERRTPRTIERAAAVGVPVEYLGIAPLFGETRLYEGPETDWTFGPYDEHEEPYVPDAEFRKLRALRDIDEFAKASIFIAHEVPKEKTKGITKAENGSTTIERSQAVQLVGAVPLPAVGIETSERYGYYAGQVIQALIKSGKVVGKIGIGAAAVAGGAAVAVAAAPFALLAGLATLDPIIVAAIPAGNPTAGSPAAWYVLVRWDW